MTLGLCKETLHKLGEEEKQHIQAGKEASGCGCCRSAKNCCTGCNRCLQSAACDSVEVCKN